MDFYSRLITDPRKALDAASITRVDELGNGYDDFGQLIAPKFEQPQQTWGETALGVATAPARIATSLVESLSPYGADGWQVPPLVQEGANALTAVGDAYNYGMSEDEINNRALGMAGFMMGGGGLAARPAAAAERAATGRYAPPLEDVVYPNAYGTTKGAMKAGGFTDEPWQNPFPGHARPVQDPETGGMLWPYDLTERATQRAGDVRGFPDLYSNASKEGAIPTLLDMGQSASVQRHPVFGHEMPLANNNPLTFEMQLSKIASGESDLPMGGDFYQAARDIQAAEVADLAAAFGGDTRKAKEFLRLLNDDNPSTAHKFEALQAEATDVPERVYADRFIYDDLARTFDDLERNPTEYAEIVNRFLADIPTGGKSQASWTSKEQAAMAVMRKAVQEGSRVGVAPDTFSRTIASNYARQFRDPQDAEFMLNELSSSLRQVNKLAANADSRPALLGAGQEQIGPERLKAIIRARMRGDK